MRRYWILTTILMFLLCGCSKGDDIPDVVEVGGQFAEETDTTMEQCLEYEYDDHETISEQTSELFDDEFQEKLSKALENKYAWKDEDANSGKESSIPEWQQEEYSKIMQSIEERETAKKEEETEATQDEDSSLQEDQSPKKSGEIPIFIFDTDMCSDVDDAFALSLLLAFERKGLIDLQGVSNVTTRVSAVYSTYALCQASKVYDMKVAMDTSTGIITHSSYINEMAKWPHKTDYYGTTNQLYREIFAHNSQKVNIVCTGQLLALYHLMNSPDGISLITQNVDTLYWCGTKTDGSAENNTWYGGSTSSSDGEPRFPNGMGEISQYVINNWPTKIVFIPADYGGSMYCYGNVVEVDRNKSDILTEALKNYRPGAGSFSAYDVFACFVAVADSCGLNEQYGLAYEKGKMSVYASGGSMWSQGQGKDYRVVLKKTKKWYEEQMNQILYDEYLVRKS